MFRVYVAFTVEDALEREPFAMWPTNAACILCNLLCNLAAGLSSGAWNGVHLRGFQPVEIKPLIELLAPGLSFVVQIYGIESGEGGGW